MLKTKSTYFKLFEQKNWQDFKIGSQKILTLELNLQNEKVNKLTHNVMMELEIIICALEQQHQQNKDIACLLFTSGKKDNFLAGADIEEIKNLKSEVELKKTIRFGQEIFNQLEDLSFPTVAVIDGACVGGGLELALSCSYIVATDNPKTKLGLPEVNLGIIPGFGGTYRLPKRIGLTRAIPLIVGGKVFDAKKAYRLGLVDKIIHSEYLEMHISKFVHNVLYQPNKIKKKRKNPTGIKKFLLQGNPFIQAFIFAMAKRAIVKQTNNSYPAPLKALWVLKKAVSAYRRRALALECKGFTSVATTDVSANLINLFFSFEALKKDAGLSFRASRASAAKKEPATLRLQQAGVVGAGVMGGGISWLFSYKDMPVYMKDIKSEALHDGYKAAFDMYRYLVKIKKMTKKERTLKMFKIQGVLDYRGFNKQDVVVEAVVENVKVKHAVLKELEANLNDKSIIVSNTSSILIDTLSTSLKKPERFAGMHFFNPVNRMPLVEIIAGSLTSSDTLEQLVLLAKKLGKVPIVVKDCAGFLVNRILLPYMNEASFLLEEGGNLLAIDDALKSFGFPMGPFTLLDEVGIDVGYKVASILNEAYGDRQPISPLLTSISLSAEHLFLGKKSGAGFYQYKNKKLSSINPHFQNFLQRYLKNSKMKKTNFSKQAVIERCVFVMINEAARCLQEGIVASSMHLDMAMILGTGFPPFRGGLLRYADSIGIDNIVKGLQALEQRYGNRFAAAPLLLKMSSQGDSFYSKTSSNK